MSHAADWEQALVTRPDGSVDRPLATRLAVPTQVEVDGSGENLVWDWRTRPSEPARIVRPDRGMLDGFVNLGDALPEKIAAYARRWGVLSHSEPNDPAWRRTEPVTTWRVLARAAQATLN